MTRTRSTSTTIRPQILEDQRYCWVSFHQPVCIFGYTLLTVWPPGILRPKTFQATGRTTHETNAFNHANNNPSSGKGHIGFSTKRVAADNEKSRQGDSGESSCESDEEHQRYRGSNESKRQKPNSTGPKYGCPFRKRNRAKFNLFDYKSCTKGWETISGVKLVVRNSLTCGFQADSSV